MLQPAWYRGLLELFQVFSSYTYVLDKGHCCKLGSIQFLEKPNIVVDSEIRAAMVFTHSQITSDLQTI
jgi:hypothetical protein